MSVTIYHNPRCSKSRKTLQILEEKGIDFELVEYLKQAPSEATLREILGMLDMQARELMRKNEAAYKELALDNTELGEDELVLAMNQNPILIERPIVVNQGKARIGRPPENILDIL